MNCAVTPIVPPEDGRHQPRTHLFVAATLYVGGGPTPVHIRNMSPSGALIEAADLPDVGSRIALKRGPLHATGHVAWRVDRRAGVTLDAPICVPDWMSRQVNPGQDGVDAMVTEYKVSGAAVPAAAQGQSTIEGELLKLRADLAQMGNALIADTIVAATHPEIQAIDIGLQRIDRMLARLRDGG